MKIENVGPPIVRRYDWHRGIDIKSHGPPDPPVVAAADGSVVKKHTYPPADPAFPDSGSFVMLKHNLGASLQYGPKTIDSYYTKYDHLGSIAPGITEGVTVNGGRQLGTMGSTPKTVTVHLHFELRVGTPNSLQYQLAHTTVGQYGYDPHMHPLLLFPPLTRPPSYGIHTTHGGSIREATFSCWGQQPILNQITVTIKGDKGDAEQRILDYNRRIGFNAEEVDTLDNQFWNPDKLHVNPKSWGGDRTFATSVTVARRYLGPSFPTGEGSPPEILVPFAFYDIWGDPFVRGSWQ